MSDYKTGVRDGRAAAIKQLRDMADKAMADARKVYSYSVGPFKARASILRDAAAVLEAIDE